MLGPRGFPYLAHLSCKLDGGLVGLTAGVADEDLGCALHGSSGSSLGHDKLGQLAGPRVMVEVRRVYENSGLAMKDMSA